LIQTIDGEKSIEDIKIGDWVLSDDPNTPGGIEYKQVLQTFNHDTTSLVDIYIDGEKITTTDTHPFWVQDVGWVAARDLNAGTHLQTKTESWLSIDKVETHTGLTTVYNFEVAGFHTYFVSDLGLLVHNSCPDALFKASQELDKGGSLTKSGRALQKHGAREGSAFPEPKGNVGAVNSHASDIVSDILSNPASSTTTRTTSRFGNVTEVRDPGGRGIRFSNDGKFIGFLEPNL
jgi:Pretoxin HINT domain